jgi:hypothetical protein
MMMAMAFFACQRGEETKLSTTGNEGDSGAALAAAVGQANTGLDFPSNSATENDIRFRFTGSNLQPMYPATYVWRINLRRQAGYYTTFYWGPGSQFTGASYYGAHPYPDGEPKHSSTNHKWSLPIDGNDYTTANNGQSTQLGYDVWKTQALRVYDDGSRKVQEFYYDLPDTSKVIRVYKSRSYGNNAPPSPALTFGTAPWDPAKKHLSGILRGLQLYSAALSPANLIAEINSPLSSAQAGSIWYMNLNPTPFDIADKSGKSHNPAWVTGLRPGLWTESGTTPAPTVALSANPASVVTGNPSTLTWSSSNATACNAGGDWSGSKAVSGSQSTGNLTASSNFTLTCTGAGGSATQSVSVAVTSTPPPAPTVTLTANPTSVASGSASTLTWTSTDATGCNASGAWSGSKAAAGSESTGNLTATGTYTLTCSGPGGSANQSATVTVTATPPPAPTVTLTANPATVNSGSASTLTWSSSNATACNASGAWSGSKAVNGSQSTGNLTATGTYTLTCTGPGGAANQTATVTVTATPPPAPTVTLAANPATVNSGSASTLTWSSTNATACNASGAWSGSKAVNGSQSTGNLTATGTYTLTCTGAGGSANQSATVTVTEQPPGGGTSGLNFPSNGGATNDVRFKFTGGNLQPMYPATYIWRVNLRRQAGYYTTFFWGPDGNFTGAGYYGAHPYPDGEPKPSGTNHKWELSIDGNDFVNDANGNSTQLGYDTWKTQAMRVFDDGTRKVHEYYWDLPDLSKVIRVYTSRSYGPPSNPALTFGTAPWAPGSEHLSGILRGLQLYSAALTPQDIVNEVNSPLGTSQGSSSIWYLNLNPTPSDIADKSGKGHNPTWVTSLRPGLWTP